MSSLDRNVRLQEIHDLGERRTRREHLRDPLLLDECRAALDALTALLGLGTVYRFQGATSA